MQPDSSKKVTKTTLDEHDDSGYVEGTPAERMAMVWEITKTAWLFKDPSFNAEQPLQRHVTKLIRRER